MADVGFEGFFAGRYGVLVQDALEAALAFGAKAHAAVVEEALAARRLWLPWRRKGALGRLTRAFHALDEKSPLIETRARYIEREADAFRV